MQSYHIQECTDNAAWQGATSLTSASSVCVTLSATSMLMMVMLDQVYVLILRRFVTIGTATITCIIQP